MTTRAAVSAGRPGAGSTRPLYTYEEPEAVVASMDWSLGGIDLSGSAPVEE
jgi:hypothetical protein